LSNRHHKKQKGHA